MNKSLFQCQKKNLKKKTFFTQHDVENKKLRKENERLRKNNEVADAEIKESIEKPIEMKIFEEDKNTTDPHPNWFDKNKFKNISAIIDSNKFNYRHKIGEFRYIEIKDLVNNIKNNKNSQISAIKGLNTLHELKNAGITKRKKNALLNRKNYKIYSTIYQIQL